MKIEQNSLRTNRMKTPFIDIQPFCSWCLSPDDMEEQKQFCFEINREGGETVWSSDWREGADNSIEVPDTCALEACTQYLSLIHILHFAEFE